jgi:hypothetical protein
MNRWALVAVVTLWFGIGLGYWGSKYFNNVDTIRVLSEQRTQIAMLHAKNQRITLQNQRLRDTQRWGYLLDMMLPACGKADWDLLNKQIKQWRSKQ